MRLQVTVWNENIQDKTEPEILAHYPQGMNEAFAKFLTREGMEIQQATLDMPEHGLTEEVLAATDVLLWWGHFAHEAVEDTVVQRVHRHVLEGMGLIVLHSGHLSKIFRSLMGTSCSLSFRVAQERARVWCVNPTHPIAQGLPSSIPLAQEEMYGEPFDIPTPDELVFVTWFEGGEIIRSGCCYQRGYGKIFYFQPGHETYGHIIYRRYSR